MDILIISRNQLTDLELSPHQRQASPSPSRNRHHLASGTRLVPLGTRKENCQVRLSIKLYVLLEAVTAALERVLGLGTIASH